MSIGGQFLSTAPMTSIPVSVSKTILMSAGKVALISYLLGFARFPSWNRPDKVEQSWRRRKPLAVQSIDEMSKRYATRKNGYNLSSLTENFLELQWFRYFVRELESIGYQQICQWPVYVAYTVLSHYCLTLYHLNIRKCKVCQVNFVKSIPDQVFMSDVWCPPGSCQRMVVFKKHYGFYTNTFFKRMAIRRAISIRVKPTNNYRLLTQEAFISKAFPWSMITKTEEAKYISKYFIILYFDNKYYIVKYFMFVKPQRYFQYLEILWNVMDVIGCLERKKIDALTQ